MFSEWTMTDEEWEESLAILIESEEEQQNQHIPSKRFEQECNRIWKEIEEEYGY